MIEYRMLWRAQSDIANEHTGLKCRQVYIWLHTVDGKVAIVSKDRQKWQFPGGKPDGDETFEQTAVRETREETGFDISAYTRDLKFFGYYVVQEVEDGNVVDTYSQVRYVLQLPKPANSYTLHAGEEDFTQVSTDVIHFAEFVSLDELERRVTWVAESDEYSSFRATLNLP